MTTFHIGSVSEGTLRTEDLLPCFARELLDAINRLDTVTGSKDTDALAQLRRLNKLHDEAGHVAYCLAEGWLNEAGEEAASEILGELMDALTELAPPYITFGAHDHDGASFGYWPNIEGMEEDACNGELPKVADTGEVPNDYRGLIMEVSDHGNVTLYERRYAKGQVVEDVELWGCV